MLIGCGGGSTTQQITDCQNLPKTGQSISYTHNDDGDLQKGTDRSFARDDQSGIVIDNNRDLIWQDSSDSELLTLQWTEAKSYCQSLSLHGYKNWRLPEIKELFYLSNKDNENNIDEVFQYTAPNFYWSNTSQINNSTVIWGIDFINGGYYTDSKDLSAHIRCVSGDPIEFNFTRDNSKEVIIETLSCLMWQDNSAAKTVRKEWTQAIAYCQELNFSGFDDWRLPNIYELYSISDQTFNNQSTSDPYWSSTTKWDDPSLAWSLSYNQNSNIDTKMTLYAVRCVRDSQ